ncbi:hypothetical protein D5b_00010 [Faustovirus]|nr:hypothetical protein D5b_00010 [Faustovirus]AMN84899.1 hypothetical protein D6_00500 [Faustovirus]AMP43970.1 hypothetical protein PRJ_Dakar_00010 [Faustovirus]
MYTHTTQHNLSLLHARQSAFAISQIISQGIMQFSIIGYTKNKPRFNFNQLN